MANEVLRCTYTYSLMIFMKATGMASGCPEGNEPKFLISRAAITLILLLYMVRPALPKRMFISGSVAPAHIDAKEEASRKKRSLRDE